MSTISSPPPNAMAAAMRGLRLAGDRAADAAATIVEAGVMPPPAGPGQRETTALLPPAGPPLPPVSVPPQPDIARGLIDLHAARLAYAANAAVLRSADEMSATLLRRTA